MSGMAPIPFLAASLNTYLIPPKDDRWGVVQEWERAGGNEKESEKEIKGGRGVNGEIGFVQKKGKATVLRKPSLKFLASRYSDFQIPRVTV